MALFLHCGRWALRKGGRRSFCRVLEDGHFVRSEKEGYCLQGVRSEGGGKSSFWEEDSFAGSGLIGKGQLFYHSTLLDYSET